MKDPFLKVPFYGVSLYQVFFLSEMIFFIKVSHYQGSFLLRIFPIKDRIIPIQNL